jgi:hypothetical protein
MKPLSILIVVLLLFINQVTYGQQDSTIDDVGDIAFIAWSASSQDGFAFVFLDDCPSGTTIKFVDEEWTGSSFYSANGEGENTWTNSTGSFVSKGTVVIIQNADNNPSTNIGTVSESNAGFDIAASSPDQIFAFVGSRSSPTFLAMIGHSSLPNNGSGSVQTLSGTGLTNGTNAIHLADEGLYTSSNTCNGSQNDCLKMLSNDSNWSDISTSLKYPNDVISSFGGSALPVSLISFQGFVNDNSILLEWETAMEQGNLGFIIERKSSANDWNEIGFIDGNGDSYEVQHYLFVDQDTPRTDFQFYRLIQVDFDGQKQVHRTIKIKTDRPHESKLRWHINSGQLHLKSKENHILGLTIINQFGQLVDYRSVGYNSTIMNCSDYPMGVYYFKVEMEGYEEILCVPLIGGD